MASTPTPSPQEFAVDLAAMKRAQLPYVDPMRVGAGTPWEDRGSNGVVKAFVQTCWMSMFRPTRLYNSIRRPETNADTRSFALTCLCFWGVAWASNSLLNLYLASQAYDDVRQQPIYEIVNAPAYYIGTLLQLIVAIAIGFYLLQFSARILHQLIIGETRAKFRPVLTLNVVSYAMGPSILVGVAILPWLSVLLSLAVGDTATAWLPFYYNVLNPVIMGGAALWIIVSVVLGTTVRLRLRKLGAVICSSIVFLVAAFLMTAAYLLGLLFWLKILGMNAIDVYQRSDEAPTTDQPVDTAGKALPDAAPAPSP